MLFVWDHVKAEQNRSKHGVSFELAQTVFDDPFHLSVLDSKNHHDERWVTIGKCVPTSTLIVVHTYQTKQDNEIVRIVSARKATKKEKKQYEEGL